MGEIGPARSELRRVFVQRTVIGAAVGALTVAATRIVLSLTPDSAVTLALWLSGSVALLLGTVAGAVVGALCAAGAASQSTHVLVTDQRLEVVWQDARVSVPARLVQAVVQDRDVVVLGRGGVELARAPGRVEPAALQRMLAQHGYAPALDADPYEDEFRTWTDDDAVGRDVRRLLAARGELLAAGSAGEAEALRRRLARSGIMVRDRRRAPWFQRSQQWRPAMATERTVPRPGARPVTA